MANGRVFVIGKQTRDVSDAARFGHIVEIEPHVSIWHNDYLETLERLLLHEYKFDYENDYLLIAGYVTATCLAALIVQPEKLLVFDNQKKEYREKLFVYPEHALEQ